MSNIILISINQTPRLNNRAIDVPTAYLRQKGFHVTPYYFHGKYTNQEIIKTLNLNNNNIIAICVTVYNYKDVINIINNSQKCKKIILFGEYITQFYKEILNKSSKIDFVILGDLENPLKELLLCNFNYEKLILYKNSIATVNQIDNKHPYYNTNFIMPVFDYLEQLSTKRKKRVEYIIQTKNSVCTGNCTFCRSQKGKIFFRDLNDIFNEIYIVNTKYGVQKIFFTDDNILDGGEIAVDRLTQLCDLIIKSKLKIAMKCYFKATSCYNKELLNKMRVAGFTTIFVGLEAGNSEDLIFYNKLTRIEDNNQIMKDLKEADIFPQIGFLMFNPHSTLKTLKENYYFLISHEIDDLFMWVSSVRLFRYTPMYLIAKKENLLYDNQEYIEYECTFKIKDIQAEHIYKFIMDKIYTRVFNLDYDFEFMYGFFLDVLQVHPEAEVYKNQIINIKNSQLERIKIFFKHFYVDNDMSYVSKNYDQFLKSFENDQLLLSNIYKNLLSIYIT